MNRHATLNRFYRLVWNDRLATYVAVAETAKGRGKRSVRAGALAAVFIAAAGLCAPYAMAGPPNPPAPTQLPTGAQVTAGSATVKQSGTYLDVNQSSNRAVINWNTFNVGAAAQVNYKQPSSSSATLNRVLDSNPSQILGKITANGQVYFVNPNGVYFGKSASVDVGALVASTHNIKDADFMAGNMKFSRDGSTGSVVNEGEIRAALKWLHRPARARSPQRRRHHRPAWHRSAGLGRSGLAAVRRRRPIAQRHSRTLADQGAGREQRRRAGTRRPDHFVGPRRRPAARRRGQKLGPA